MNSYEKTAIKNGRYQKDAAFLLQTYRDTASTEPPANHPLALANACRTVF